MIHLSSCAALLLGLGICIAIVPVVMGLGYLIRKLSESISSFVSKIISTIHMPTPRLVPRLIVGSIISITLLSILCYNTSVTPCKNETANKIFKVDSKLACNCK